MIKINSVYLYVSVCVMFHGAQLLFQMPPIFINEEYVNTHSVYGYCNAHGTSAVMEYQWWYPHCRVPHQDIIQNAHRILRHTGSFLWVKAKHDNQGFGKIIFWLWSYEQCIRNLHGDWYCTVRYGGFLTVVWFIHYHIFRVQTFVPAMSNFVNGCDHVHKFCPTFYSRMRLTLYVMVSTSQGISLLGKQYPHEVVWTNVQ
jgi:hypothetical protein